MMKKGFLYVAICVLASNWCHAQNVWTLDECINYAIKHNINILQRAVQIKQQEVELNTSRNARLPEINAKLSEQFSFGNYNATTGTLVVQDGSTNNDLAYTTGQITASIPIFEGFKIRNQIKANEFSLKAMTANLEKAQKDISIQIATYYLQCLYYKGLADIARSQEEVSKNMVKKANALIEEGKRSKSELADAEAQLSRDQFVLADAEGQSSLALLTLSQLLNLPAADGFEVAEIEAVAPSVLLDAQVVYNQSVESFPSVLAAKAQLKANDYLEKMARAEYIPKLSLQGTVNSFYVNMFHQTNNWGDFGTQFRNNLNEVIGLHLVIPIFNRYRTRNNIRRAKLNVLNQSLALDESRQKLLKEIEQAYHNAKVAQNKILSANKMVEASRISADYEQERYNAGRSNIFDLQQVNQKLVKARQDALQAKFEYQIYERILRYYRE